MFPGIKYLVPPPLVKSGSRCPVRPAHWCADQCWWGVLGFGLRLGLGICQRLLKFGEINKNFSLSGTHQPPWRGWSKTAFLPEDGYKLVTCDIGPLEKKLYHTGHVVTTPGWALPVMAASPVQEDSWAERRSCDVSEQSVHNCGSSSHCTTALCVLNRTVKDSSVTPDLWHYQMVVLGYFTVLSSMIVLLPQVQPSTSPRWTSKTPKSTMSEFRTLTAPNNRTTSTTSSAARKRARARRRSWPRLTLACPATSSEFLVLVSVQSCPRTLCVCVSVVYYLQWFDHNMHFNCKV